MIAHPVRLERQGDQKLMITWSDGDRRVYAVRELRDRCPCATCREKRSQQADKPASLLPIVTEADIQPLRVISMQPVGNYAYSIAFSDGHDTGIYVFELLKQLGRVEPT